MAYCGYVVKVEYLRPHTNADRLQIATVFGNDVVVGLDVHFGQMMIYFPTDGQLSEEYCAFNDLVRRKDENGNPAGGYLDPDKRNVKAIRLRGEKSDGMLMPLTSVANWTSISDLKIGDQITTLGGVEICRKYIPRRTTGGIRVGVSGGKKAKANFAPTFYEHVDTAQLAYNLGQFKSGDIVELTLKMHGTSGRTGYLPINKQMKRTILDKILRRPGKQYKEYDYVTGTRRVVLDSKHDGGFYEDNNFRLEMAKKFDGKLRKGEVAYYEIVGFVNSNTPIMASVKNSKIKDKEFTKQYGEETVFSYGCVPYGGWEEVRYSVPPDVLGDDDIIPPKCEVYVYRMTMVNEDGDVVEMSPDQMRVRCEQMGVKTVPVFERFIVPENPGEVLTDKAGDTDYGVCSPGEYVLRKVEQYFDGPDPIGKTHIREGVVARIVNRPDIAVYKHKNFNFKVLEGIIKEDATAPDMEEAQDEMSVEEDGNA